jgi:hypothetical protein
LKLKENATKETVFASFLHLMKVSKEQRKWGME